MERWHVSAWLAFLALAGVALAPRLDPAERCGELLHALQHDPLGPDTDGLARRVWTCFDRDRDRLRELAPDDPAALRALEGSPAEADALLAARRDAALLAPAWRPASGGVEQLIEAYEVDPWLRVRLHAALPAGTVERGFAFDLSTEVAVGAHLRVEHRRDPTPEVEDALARRVYHVARALSGPIGALVAEDEPVRQWLDLVAADPGTPPLALEALAHGGYAR